MLAQGAAGRVPELCGVWTGCEVMRVDGPSPGRVPALEDIDLCDARRYVSGSQHPFWAVLRERAPVWRSRTDLGVPFWSVTRHRDAVAVLKDTRHFSSVTGIALSEISGDPAGGKTIILSDPPTHTYFRGPLAKIMMSRASAAHDERGAATIRRLVAPCLEGGRHDFARLVDVLPMVSMGEVLGVSREYWSDVARWTMTGFAPEDPAYATGDREETLRVARHKLFALLAGIVEERREEPAEDLISALLTLDLGGRRLTKEEVLLNCYTFVMGAATTTPHVAGHMLLAFIEHRAAWEQLKQNPSLVPLAVEEACRWASPINHLMRRTTSEVEIAGTTIPAGAAVCVWTASANRDEAVFPEPYTFDPARQPNQHLAFGLGRHYCLGARAARTALGVLLDELLDRFDHFELAGDPLHLRSTFLNGMSSLPVVAYPRARGGPAR